MRYINEHIDEYKLFLKLINEKAEDIDMDNIADIVIDIEDEEYEEIDITKGELEDDGKDNDTEENPEIYERRMRVTKKMRKSNKVVAAVSKDLFGPTGTHRDKVEKLFKIFRKALREKAAQMKVSPSLVKNTKLVLRTK